MNKSESLYCFTVSSCTEILESCMQFGFLVRIGQTFEHDLLFFVEVNVRVEKLFQCRRNHRTKHIEVRQSVRPMIDRDAISSSIDFAVSTSSIQRKVI